jgi:myo-inositol-1(or 4)-monophosphatase
MISSIVKVAEEAARLASNYLMDNLGGDSFSQIKESHHSIVSGHDVRAEKIIIDEIRKKFPDHGIISEESGVLAAASKKIDYLWILDPLDGSSYYLRGLSSFSISVAVLYQGKLMVGIVNCPLTGEKFVAIKGEGATLNSSPISVSKTSALAEAIMSFGHGFLRTDNYETSRRKILNSIRSIRAGGSCAMEVCYLACGRLDGVVQLNQSVWDYAAATLILEEAGGDLTGFDGNSPNFQERGKKDFSFVASNKLLHNSILQTIIGD